MNKRIQSIARQIIADRAIMQTVVKYHDGHVSCRMIQNSRTSKVYFMQGQLCRDVATGRFVSLSQVMKG
jgi:hypothetical protein